MNYDRFFFGKLPALSDFQAQNACVSIIILARELLDVHVDGFVPTKEYMRLAQNCDELLEDVITICLRGPRGRKGAMAAWEEMIRFIRKHGKLDVYDEQIDDSAVLSMLAIAFAFRGIDRLEEDPKARIKEDTKDAKDLLYLANEMMGRRFTSL